MISHVGIYFVTLASDYFELNIKRLIWFLWWRRRSLCSLSFWLCYLVGREDSDLFYQPTKQLVH